MFTVVFTNKSSRRANVQIIARGSHTYAYFRRCLIVGTQHLLPAAPCWAVLHSIKLFSLYDFAYTKLASTSHFLQQHPLPMLSGHVARFDLWELA